MGKEFSLDERGETINADILIISKNDGKNITKPIRIKSKSPM